MASPYVRRVRLARELRELREAAGLSHAELAEKANGPSKWTISRLENARIWPDVGDVVAILDALGVGGARWVELRQVARDAAERGWWHRDAGRMGERQAMYADLEHGAATIREYQLTYVPGLLQTEEYVRAVTEFDDLTLVGTEPVDPEAMVRARAQRQRMLRSPGGPKYEVIIDELIVQRPTVPAGILAAQLRRLANPGDGISVHVLPIAAQIEAFSVPKSAFSLYTYADPRDGVIAAVDTVTADDVLTDEDKVLPYEQLYDRLRKAALSAQDSATLLARAADEITGRIS